MPVPVSAALAAVMSESTFSEHVRKIAADLRKHARPGEYLLAYHTYDSRKSYSGYPDWHFVGSKGQLVRELKIVGEKPTVSQNLWLQALTKLGVDADVWTPNDLVSQRVHRELMAIR